MTVNTLAMDLRTTRLQVEKRGISGHPAGPAPRIKPAVQTLCALRTAYTVPHYSKHRQRPAHLRLTLLSTDTDRPPGLLRYIPLPRRFLRFFFYSTQPPQPVRAAPRHGAAGDSAAPAQLRSSPRPHSHLGQFGGGPAGHFGHA